MASRTPQRKLVAALAAGTLAMFGVAGCEVDDDVADDPLMEEEPAEDDPFGDETEDDLDDGEDDL